MSRNPFSRDKAQKSQKKDIGKLSSLLRKTLPAALSATPSVTAAIYQGNPDSGIAQHTSPLLILNETPTESKNVIPTPSEDIAGAPQAIFSQNIAPPVVKYSLPDIGGRITSTTQLAYCLSLLNPSLILEQDINKTESDWLQSRINDPHEQERLKTMATDLIEVFLRDELKKPTAVAEVVSLTAVLDQDAFRKLLQAFVDGINQSALLEIHLLDGLAQLIRNAPQGYIEADDLVKTLEILSGRLKNTREQSTRHAYRLALTISNVLDSMVDGQVKGVSRELLHEPLSEYLSGLQESPDTYLVYQAAYAYQALMYIPDDETILQTTLRRTGKAIRGISGMVSAVKALDLMGFIEGLRNIQGSLGGAGEAIVLVSGAYQHSKALAESGQGFLETLRESLSFTRKSAWYPALRGLDALIQDARFAEFEELVRGAPCKHNPVFQWGVCQRLGVIAGNSVWGADVRKCAVALLGELYKDDATWGQQPNVKQWILSIIGQLADSPSDIAANQMLLQEFETDRNTEKRLLYQNHEKNRREQYLVISILPPQESLLLERVLNKPDVEIPLRQLKRERLENRNENVYISPRAKASPRAKEDFDLTSSVRQFLESDRKVFLILGDSGAGKSTFNKALETSLWDEYNKDCLIPLFIHLPAIKEPELDLVAKQLRKFDFTENQIRELKAHRKFIVICDGYDESQQTHNLYMSNQLNQPGGWRAQMVISCRTEYNEVDYKYCFEPTDRNNGGNADLFQEAIIAPFNKSQIQDYVDQYVSLKNPFWKSKDYQQAFKLVPNLKDLVKNPFLLRLALDALPRLLEANSKFSVARVTRVELYDAFIAQWIERGKIRLSEMDLSPHDKIVFKGLSNPGFKHNGVAYLKEFATVIYDNQSGNPVVSYLERRDRGTWKEALFNRQDGRHLLREAIPLARDGDQYRFIHKSVLEYGLSLAVFDPNDQEENMEPTLSISRRGSSSSILSFENAVSAEATTISLDQSLIESPLGRRNFVGEPSILQF